jgi:hypothetical protein
MDLDTICQNLLLMVVLKEPHPFKLINFDMMGLRFAICPQETAGR